MLDINAWVKALNTMADEQRAAGTFVNLYETFKTFWVYERLDKGRKKYIDQFLLYEFGSSNSYSSDMSELYLANFLLFLNEGYLPFNPDDIDCEKYRSFSWRITDKKQKIVFAKPKENTKPTKDKHGYPMDKYNINTTITPMYYMTVSYLQHKPWYKEGRSKRAA